MRSPNNSLEPTALTRHGSSWRSPHWGEGLQRGGMSAAVAGRPPRERAMRADGSGSGRWVMHLGALALVLALLAAPLAAEAQQPPGKTARIGYLTFRSGPSHLDEAFRQGLRELGYVEGQNIAIEYRWAAISGRIEPRRSRWSWFVPTPTSSFPPVACHRCWRQRERPRRSRSSSRWATRSGTGW